MTIIPCPRIQPSNLGDIPSEGRRVIPYVGLDLANAPLDIDLVIPFQQGQFTTPQSIYVENRTATADVIFTNPVSGQVLVFPKSSVGYYSILQPRSGLKFTLTSSGAPVINLAVLNFYVLPQVWNTP